MSIDIIYLSLFLFRYFFLSSFIFIFCTNILILFFHVECKTETNTITFPLSNTLATGLATDVHIESVIVRRCWHFNFPALDYLFWSFEGFWMELTHIHRLNFKVVLLHILYRGCLHGKICPRKTRLHSTATCKQFQRHLSLPKRFLSLYACVDLNLFWISASKSEIFLI